MASTPASSLSGIRVSARRVVRSSMAQAPSGFSMKMSPSRPVFTIGGFSAHAGQSQILDWIRKMAHPGMQVVLVHGEESTQILSGLIKDQFHLSVYAPGYLEEMALAAGATPEVVVTAQPKSYAHVDWDLLLEETGKLSKLRTRLEKAGERPWDEQVDIRDRILELNKELLSVLTQL
ncbi:MAG: MBL fold metallo-hydrolase RNA specificity domain-containing protein [Bilophila wadsworthia]